MPDIQMQFFGLRKHFENVSFHSSWIISTHESIIFTSRKTPRTGGPTKLIYADNSNKQIYTEYSL